MGKLATAAIVISGLFFMSGCGAVTYKTGAGADQLAADQQACKADTSANADVSRCMAAKGWKTWDVAGKAATVPDAPAAPVISPVISPVTTPVSSPVATPVITAPPQPAGRVSVSSWWRAGPGNPGDAIARCVAILGNDHKPDATAKLATQALIACMKDAGWRAL